MDAEEWGEEGASQMVSGGVSLPWRIPGIRSRTSVNFIDEDYDEKYSSMNLFSVTKTG